MKKIILISITFILLLTNITVVTSQEIQEDINTEFPQAPTTAGLGNYGNIPVGLYTGTSNFSIPLYTINFDGLQIPITLSYLSTGLRVQEDASWVGLGWNLNATCVITRAIKAYDDLLNGYPYDPSLPEIDSDGELLVLPSSEDIEPDIFNYSLFGSSGKFVLRKSSETASGEIEPMELVLSSNKIIYDEPNMNWIIIDGNGFKYYFDVKEITMTLSGSGTNKVDALQNMQLTGKTSTQYDPVTAWYLSKIESPNGKIIEFHYDLDDDGLSNYFTMSAASYGHVLQNSELPFHLPMYDGIYNSIDAYLEDNYNKVLIYQTQGTCGDYTCSRSLTFNVVQTHITYNGLRIDFNTSEREDIESFNPLYYMTTEYSHKVGNTKTPQKVIGLTISDEYTNYTKSIEFEQSYFPHNGGTFNETTTSFEKADWLRLKLDAVQIDDKRYEFNYYNDARRFPQKSTTEKDYWGYWNGYEKKILTQDNYCQVPAYFLKNSTSGYVKFKKVYHPNWMPVEDYCKTGVLQSVIYPTGGRTVFDYESHTYTYNNENFETYSGGRSSFYADTYSGIDEVSFTVTNTTNIVINYSLYFGKPSESTTSAFDYEFTNTNLELLSIIEEGEVLENADFSVLSGVIDALAKEVINGQKTLEENKSTSYTNNNITLAPGTYVMKATKQMAQGDYAHASINVSIRNEDLLLDDPDIENYSDQHIYGGLRIKSIKDYATNNTVSSNKKYVYLTSSEGEGKSTGFLMNSPEYLRIFFQPPNDPQTVESLNNAIVNDLVNTHKYILAYADDGKLTLEERNEILENENNPVIWFIVIPNIHNILEFSSSAQGSPLGYNQVREFVLDKDDNKLYETAHHFRNDKNILDVKDFMGPNFSFGCVNSSLKSKNTGIKLQEEYEYKTSTMENLEVRGAYLRRHQTAGSNGENVYDKWGDYKIRQFNKLIEKETIIKDNVTSTTTYEYNDDHVQPNVITTNSSNGDEKSTEYLYPFDIATHDLVPCEMWDETNSNYKHIIDKPIVVKTYHNQTITSKKQTKYLYDNVNDIVVPEYTETFPSATSVKVKLNYNYNENGNLVEYHKEDGMYVSFVLGYNDSRVIVKGENVSHAVLKRAVGNVINSINTPYQYTNGIADLDKFLNDMGHQIIEQQKDTWSQFNELLYQDPSLVNAFIQTASYLPLVGISSITNPQGKTTHYEYDDFGRLITTKDHKENILQSIEYHYKEE